MDKYLLEKSIVEIA